MVDVSVRDIKNPLKDRAEALRTMGDKGIGISRDEHISDKKMVDSYINDE